MSALCDWSILEALAARELLIEPFVPSRVQPCSVDLTLGSDFLLPDDRIHRAPVSIARGDQRFPEYEVVERKRYIMRPGQFILGSTRETLYIGPNHRGRIEGKSTLGRMGLMVHCTAGYLDPGFRGQVTLELLNVAPYPIELVAGEPVCQVAYDQLSGRPEHLYGDPVLGSHYQHQQGVTAPRL